jgi:hypothetical protein
MGTRREAVVANDRRPTMVIGRSNGGDDTYIQFSKPPFGASAGAPSTRMSGEQSTTRMVEIAIEVGEFL